MSTIANYEVHERDISSEFIEHALENGNRFSDITNMLDNPDKQHRYCIAGNDDVAILVLDDIPDTDSDEEIFYPDIFFFFVFICDHKNKKLQFIGEGHYRLGDWFLHCGYDENTKCTPSILGKLLEEIPAKLSR